MEFRVVLFKWTQEDWQKYIELPLVDFRFTTNIFSVGGGEFSFVANKKLIDELTPFVFLVGAFIDDKLVYGGILTGVEYSFGTNGRWIGKLYTKEFLHAFSRAFAFGEEYNTMGVPYQIGGKAPDIIKELMNAYADRYVRILDYTNHDLYGEMQMNIGNGTAMSVSKIIYDTSLAYPGLDYLFSFKYDDNTMLKPILRMWNNRTLDLPVKYVKIDEYWGDVNNPIWSNFKLKAVDNYWNAVIVQGDIDKTVNSYGYADPYGNVTAVGNVNRNLGYLEAQINDKPRIQKRFENTAMDNYTMYANYDDAGNVMKGLLNLGLKRLFVLDVDFRGSWDDVKLYQKIHFNLQGVEEELFVGAKTIDRTGKVSVNLIKDKKDLSVDVI